MEIFSNGHWLPLTFAALMGLAILIYAVLDGYDLGVGILIAKANDAEKDKMIASIGPFWDANETWLVLAVGLLLVAFPTAHGIILTNLYLPVAFLMIGLIMRGVAFDFRVKAKDNHKNAWNNCFFLGSLISALTQGYMLGAYILGFDNSLTAHLFSVFIGICLVAGYCLIGASWLIMKTEGELQQKAVIWAKYALKGTVFGIAIVSLATPLTSERIFNKWLDFPNILFLTPIPLITIALIIYLARFLQTLPKPDDKHCFIPFFATILIFLLCFIGLSYSFFPYIVPDSLKIVDAASAPESLMIILVGTAVILPILIIYTFVAYRIFHGKAQDLSYD
jgi:cytochrome bd ubiquinol oxidase subunit II